MSFKISFKLFFVFLYLVFHFFQNFPFSKFSVVEMFFQKFFWPRAASGPRAASVPKGGDWPRAASVPQGGEWSCAVYGLGQRVSPRAASVP